MIKEIAMTETRELDCMIVVETTPKPMLFHSLSVVLARSFSNRPPVNALNPRSRKYIPNKNIETPAAMVLKSGLHQQPTSNMMMMEGKNMDRNILIVSSTRYLGALLLKTCLKKQEIRRVL